MRVADEELKEGYEFLDFQGLTVEICATLSEPVIETFRRLEASGIPVSLKSRQLRGVHRFQGDAGEWVQRCLRQGPSRGSHGQRQDRGRRLL